MPGARGPMELEAIPIAFKVGRVNHDLGSSGSTRAFIIIAVRTMADSLGGGPYCRTVQP